MARKPVWTGPGSPTYPWLALPDRQDRKEWPEHRASRVQPVRQVQQARREQPDHRVLQAPQGGQPVQPVRQGLA